MRCLHGLSIATAMVELLVVAGSFNGWPSLQYVLAKQGYFANACHQRWKLNETLQQNATDKDLSSHSFSCSESEEAFNLVYQLSIACLNVSTLAFSYTLDRFGTWVARTIASLLMFSGYAILCLARPDNSWLLFPTVTFISSPGLLLLITNTQLGNLVPQHRSLYVTLINGVFDSGTVTFLVFKIAYDRGFDPSAFFGIMTAFSGLCVIRTFLLMPRATIPYPLVDKNLAFGVFEWKKKKSEKIIDMTAGKSEDFLTETTVKDAYFQVPSFKSCLLSKTYIFHALFYCAGYIRYTVFVGGAIAWLASFNNDDDVSHYTEVLGYTLTAGAVVAPLNGLVADFVIGFYRKRATDQKLAILRGLFAQVVLTAVLQLLLSVAVLAKQLYLSFVLVLFFKSFLFGTAFNFIAQAFPNEHFGKLMGVAQVVVGVSSLLQYALFKCAVDLTNGFALVNLFLLCGSVLCFGLPVYLWLVSYKLSLRQCFRRRI